MRAHKFIVVLPLALMTTYACTRVTRKESWPPTEPGITTAALNLRRGAATTWQIITVLPKGAKVDIRARVGDWVQIASGKHVGYAAGRYVKSLAVLDVGAVALGTLGVEKFLPAHRKILEETGWFRYAHTNLDSLQYYDWLAFDSPSGPAVGLAVFENGHRVARIAIKGRTDSEIAATIIHESAHLAGIAQTGNTFGEDMAQAVEARFRDDLALLAQRALFAPGSIAQERARR